MHENSVQHDNVEPQAAPRDPQQVLLPDPWLVPQTYPVCSGQHSPLLAQGASAGFGVQVPVGGGGGDGSPSGGGGWTLVFWQTPTLHEPRQHSMSLPHG